VGGSDAYDEKQLYLAMQEGKNIGDVQLAQPHHGGSVLKDIAAVGLPLVTEIIGGGPEDPLADGAAAGEVSAIEGGTAAADAAAGAEDGLNLALKYKEGWTPEQIAEADAKVAKLDEAAQRGDAQVTKSPVRGPTAASKVFKDAGGLVPSGYDVDHVIDLQLGGEDSLSNMLPLNSSVNRSLGAQIMHAIKEAESGTLVRGVTIK
jgi:filamentous hemagglutinin